VVKQPRGRGTPSQSRGFRRKKGRDVGDLVRKRKKEKNDLLFHREGQPNLILLKERCWFTVFSGKKRHCIKREGKKEALLTNHHGRGEKKGGEDESESID